MKLVSSNFLYLSEVDIFNSCINWAASHLPKEIDIEKVCLRRILIYIYSSADDHYNVYILIRILHTCWLGWRDLPIPDVQRDTWRPIDLGNSLPHHVSDGFRSPGRKNRVPGVKSKVRNLHRGTHYSIRYFTLPDSPRINYIVI